jgi:hypothetical protein
MVDGSGVAESALLTAEALLAQEMKLPRPSWLTS